MALDAAIDRFLAHQRSFGRGYGNAEYILRALRRFVAHQSARDLSASIFERWCKVLQHLSPNTRYACQLLVRKLCLFRQRSEPGCFVPDRSNFARPQPYPPPVIVTSAQVAKLLRAADELAPSRYGPLRPAVMRIAIILLYTAGLRRREVVRLQLADIDARHGVCKFGSRSSTNHAGCRSHAMQPESCVATCAGACESPTICGRARRYCAMPVIGTGTSAGMLMLERLSVTNCEFCLSAQVYATHKAVGRDFRTCGIVSQSRLLPAAIAPEAMYRRISRSSPCTWATSRSTPRPTTCTSFPKSRRLPPSDLAGASLTSSTQVPYE